MVKAYCPFLSRVFGGRLTAFTFSLLVGLGVGACSDDGAPEEPVAADGAEASTGEAGDADQVAAAPESEGKAEAASDAAEPAGEAQEGSSDGAVAEATGLEATDGEAPALPAEKEADKMIADAQATDPEGSQETSDDRATDDAPAASTAPLAALTPTPMDDSSATSAAAEPAAEPMMADASKHTENAATGSSGSGNNTYTVAAGDTLGQIAQKIYGSAHFWNMLATENGIEPPYTIHPGDSIKFEANNEQSRSFAQQDSGQERTITVKSGDTLSGIAHRVYGHASAWPSIYKHNQDKISDPHKIEPGMVLICVVQGGGEQSADEMPADSAPAKKSAHHSHGKGHKSAKTRRLENTTGH